MAKYEKNLKQDDQEMSVEDARKIRAANHKPQARVLSLEERREAFRVFWVGQKSKYQKSKEIEQVLWVHLKAIKMDKPEDFEAGIQHFGLKRIGQ